MNEAGKFDGRFIAQRTTNKKGVHTQACMQAQTGILWAPTAKSMTRAHDPFPFSLPLGVCLQR